MPLVAPLPARGIVYATYVAFCVIAYIHVIHSGVPGGERVSAAGYLLVVFLLQVYFSRADSSPSAPLTHAVLIAQAFLVLVPLTQFGTSWIGMPTLLAANAVLVLAPRWGWVVFGLVVLMSGVVAALLGFDSVDVARAVLGTAIGALEIYGLTRLARLITVVHAARADLGRAAVARERMRFARDLHDLLGLSLSTVGPKAVEAHEAVGTDPARARRELGEILRIARHALTDVRLVAGGYRDISLDVEPALADVDVRVPRRTGTFAGWLMRVVFVGFLVSLGLKLLAGDSAAATVLACIGYGLGLLLVQLGYVSRIDREFRPPIAYLVLVAQAILVFLPLWQFGPDWVSMPGLLAGSALLLLRAPAGRLVFVSVIGVSAAGAALQETQPLAVAELVASTAIVGLVTYGLTWMARAMHQLRDARHELARIAVAEERMRFARDLHDLLGLSLSAITLKAELAQRLLSVDRERTRRELTEIAAISRSALADVRLVANGYRELSLNEESRSAESVLAAADVDVRLEMRYGRLSTEVRTVLATILREGATNVLRHSVKGARCEITVRQAHNLVMLEIVNNGVAPRASSGGSGLRNLAVRVQRLGGELTAGLESDGTFRLSVRIPV